MTRSGSASYTVSIAQSVRSEGDALVVEGLGGNDSIDAHRVATDAISVELRGGDGNDTLVGSRFADVLDGGLGDDTFTGGEGLDVFRDAGGHNTLKETFDRDMGLFDNLFVVGQVTNASNPPTAGTVSGGFTNDYGSPLGPVTADAWAAGAVAENLGGLFGTAILTGGSGRNVIVVGDLDGKITIGGVSRDVLSWTGDATLDNKDDTTGPAGADELYVVNLRSLHSATISDTGGNSGTDDLVVIGTLDADALALETGKVTFGPLATPTAGTVTYSGIERLALHALDGSDVIALRSTNIDTTIFGGTGLDAYAVGSAAAIAAGGTLTNTGGNVDLIQGDLALDGGPGLDSLTVDDTASTTAKTGTLTFNRVGGLATKSGIGYGAFESLAIALGSGGDTFTIQSTHLGPARTTSLTTNGGADHIAIQTIDGPTTVDAGEGADTLTIGTNAPSTAGKLAGIRSSLSVTGGAGADSISLDDTGTTTDQIGVVTPTTVAGMGMTLNASAPQPDLVQVVTVANAFNGRFTLSVAGKGTTVQLDYDATQDAVRTALEAILGAGNVSVMKAGSRWLIAYTGALAGAAGRALPPITLSAIGLASDPNGPAVVTGVGAMTDGLITYSAFETFTAGLGSGADVLDVVGTIAGTTTVNAGPGDDSVFVDSTGGATNVNGEAGRDLLVVNALQRTGNGFGGTLSLDGGAGADTTIVGLFGSGDSTVAVDDTGNDGATNVLIVNGTPGADQFLLRKRLIALLTVPVDGLYTHAEKVTYTSGINGGVVVNGLNGDDDFAMDDNASVMTVNGGTGNDSFHVGQLFTSYVADPAFGITPADFFASTRGLLSNGVSFATTINGGTGDDFFEVFRNKAVLQLNGDSGDDTFIIRSFIAEGSTTTGVNSGDGRDFVQYAVNAPVSIDGGDGYDTVIVVGTEAPDDFVITSVGIYGAGRFVSYLNIEKLVIEGMEGNDRFYVLSTNANVETRVFGGLGSDTVYVGSHAPAVQANDLIGYSGLIGESVESTSGTWNGLPVDGLMAEIADNDAPSVIITPENGALTVSEAGGTDAYSVVLAFAPAGIVQVTFAAPAIDPNSTDRSRAILLSLDGVNWDTSVTAVLTPANFATPVRILVKAAYDLSSEDTRAVPIQAMVVGGGAYDGLALPNTLVRTLDDDAVGVVVTEVLGGTRIVEGDTGRTYQVVLTRQPIANVTLTLHVTAPGQVLVGPSTLTFTPGDWNTPKFVTVSALDDGVVQGFYYAYVDTAVTSNDVISGTVTGLTGRQDEFVVASAPFPATTDALHGYLVRFTSGRNAGQVRHIWGSSATTIVSEGAWDFMPAIGDTFVITGYDSPVGGNAPVGGTVSAVDPTRTTITLSGANLPTANGGLTGAIVRITDGSGGGEYRTIASNTATTITVSEPWSASTGAPGEIVLGVGTNVTVLEIPGVLVDRVAVQVADADTRLVIVTESQGTTRLVEGGATDTFTVRLSRSPGAETVTVRIAPQITGALNGQTFTQAIRVSVAMASGTSTYDADGNLVLTFDASNWDVEQTVRVTAIDDSTAEGYDLQAFAAQARRLAPVQGPLFVSGGFDTEFADALSLDNYLPVLLPGESSGHPTPATAPSVDAIEDNQVDTLIADNSDSPANDVGALTSTRLTGLGMAPDTYVAGRLLPGGIVYAELEALNVLLGYGNDTFTVESTHGGTTTIAGGAGNDSFRVRTISGHTAIDAGAGDDTFQVGTTAGLGGPGVLDSLDALLALDGGTGTDTLNLDDSADTKNDLGWLTQTTLTGLDMIARDGIDRLWSVTPQPGATSFTIVLAGVGARTFAVGTDADTIAASLQSLLFPNPNSCGTQGQTACAQSVFVWRFGNDYLVGLRGERHGPSSPDLLAIGAGAAAIDRSRIDGVNYYGVETLNLALGSGNDVMNVQGTSAVTNLSTGPGDDRIYVSSKADVPIDGHPDYLTGDLNQIAGTLNLDAGSRPPDADDQRRGRHGGRPEAC